MARERIIIGIHGLGNKPPAMLLGNWWRLAITEGLTAINAQTDFNFELVYWADVLNDNPLDPDETDDDSDYFIKEKYLPATAANNNAHNDSVLHKISGKFNNLIFNKKLHENFPSVTDWVIKNFFAELDIYLNDKTISEDGIELPVKEIIKERLKSILLMNKNKKIMLIAHSMGSIIAYDVLNELSGRINIDTLITIGSPLGVPFINDKMKHDSVKSLKTPDVIEKAWYNFADPDDKLAVNFELDKIFSPNDSGIVPKGMLVENNYEMNGEKNPHKSFGYLRTPELAFVIKKFTEPERNKLRKWFESKLDKFKTIFGKK